jgi:XTP/dITP diphosphohydrolase
MRLVVATRNRDKAREIVAMLAGLDVQVVTMEAYPDAPATIEDGETLEANAWKKAREVRAHTGCSALADDTGLEVDALDGAPGVLAARYAGENATYADNCRKLLHALKDVPIKQRGARFRTVMALALTPDDAARLTTHTTNKIDGLTTHGVLNGHIGTQTHGERGFGYDPVFVDGATGRSLAEMTPDEKNRSSHRYRALLEMREMLIRHGLVRETETDS